MKIGILALLLLMSCGGDDVERVLIEEDAGSGTEVVPSFPDASLGEDPDDGAVADDDGNDEHHHNCRHRKHKHRRHR